MSIPGYFQYCDFAVEFEVWNHNASRSFLIVQTCFGYPGFFTFPYEIEYCSFEVCKEFYWDFDDHCTESVDCSW